MLIHMSDDEKKVVFYIISRNCWACDDLKKYAGKFIDFNEFCALCKDHNCRCMCMIYDLVRDYNKRSFKDVLGFDCSVDDVKGWNEFFKGRTGWAS